MNGNMSMQHHEYLNQHSEGGP